MLRDGARVISLVTASVWAKLKIRSLRNGPGMIIFAPHAYTMDCGPRRTKIGNQST